MVQVHKIYGSVAVLPITLTWIYISWSIALVGCRLCYALDASRKPEPHPAIQAAAARETFIAAPACSRWCSSTATADGRRASAR